MACCCLWMHECMPEERCIDSDAAPYPAELMPAAVRQVHVHGLRIALPEAAVEIGADGLLVGCSADAHVTVDHAEVRHSVACDARILYAKIRVSLSGYDEPRPEER